MCAQSKQSQDRKPGLLVSILRNRCPRCRRGNMYQTSNPYQLKKVLAMHDDCPVCGQPMEPEVGFYYGTGYVSYGLAVAVCVATFIAWWVLVGFSIYDNRIFWWLGLNSVLLVLLQPVLMRLSRTIWIYCFVYYSARWREEKPGRPERTNDALKNAW